MHSWRLIRQAFPFAVILAVLATVVIGSGTPADTRVLPPTTVQEPAKVFEHEVPIEEPESVSSSETAKPESPATPDDTNVPERADRSDGVVAELPETAVQPFSMVGVTWSGKTKSSDLNVQVRWRDRYTWSNWTELELDLENTATEGGRPGTEPQWVGKADGVAVRVTSTNGTAPADLKVATIDPGKASTLTPAAVSQPTIIMRSAWGASGGSSCDSPTTSPATKGAVIHHTAGSNSYSKSESASIVKSTQAYHTGSRGWCDIGYNFLVDKYGQIFEGRKGGITKTVRGAHAGNGPVNEQTMGVSLMGTFTSAEAPEAMRAAVVKLVSWRFAQDGVKAKGTYSVGGLTLNRIAGHRNVVSTECPGARVYSWLSASGGLRDRVEDALAGSPTDPTSYAVPKNLRSTATAKDSLTFAWDAVPDAPQYRIQLSTSSSMSGATYHRFVPTTGTITGLNANTTYYAKVRVITADGGNLSDYSSPAVAVKTGSATSNVPQNLRSTATAKDSLSFAWDAVPDAPQYRIQLSTSSSMSGATYHRFVPTTGTITGLNANTTYYAKVRVITTDGVNLSDYSSPAVAVKTAPSSYATPTGLKLSSAAKDSLTFSWNAVTGAPKYRIQLSKSSSMSSATYHRFTPTTGTVNGLTANTTYYAKVRVITEDGVNLSPYSSAIQVKTAANTAPASTTVNESYTVPSSRSIALRGHGYGHGIGMGQYGAQGAAKQGKKYEQILDHYYPGTDLSSKSGSIRVLLTRDSSHSVIVTGRSGLVFRNLVTNKTIALPTTIGGKSVVRWSINPTAGKTTQSSLQYSTGSGYTTYQNTNWTGEGQFEGPSDMTLILPDNSGMKLRGALRSAPPSKGSTSRDTVNVLSVEDYTRGVVSAEMPSSWMPEALKAQSVAARTYGVRSLTPTRYYDICDTTSCQVYGGVSKETAATDAAISATKGKILTYGGKPAFTQFSSSNGGYSTAGSQPYLKAASDPWDTPSVNPHHTWTASIAASKLEKAYTSIGTLKQLKVTKRTGGGDWGGRVLELSLIGSKKTVTITGTTARSVMGLKSHWFRLGS